VFHCTYGKDRTGLAAVLVLHSLGVDAATIRHDYLLTNQLLQPAPLPGKVLTPKAQQVLLGVQADFLEAALNTIDASFGGMGAYLEQALGLDSTKRLALRNAYLV
jgi:protein-tyrosine phosphatase